MVDPIESRLRTYGKVDKLAIESPPPIDHYP